MHNFNKQQNKNIYEFFCMFIAIKCKICVIYFEPFQGFLIYAAAFYGNMGNYKSFGDTKFIPNVDEVTICYMFLAYKINIAILRHEMFV